MKHNRFGSTTRTLATAALIGMMAPGAVVMAQENVSVQAADPVTVEANDSVSVGAIREALAGNDADRALRMANDRLAAHPNEDQTRFLKANALAGTGDVDGAIDLLKELSTRYETRADVWNNLGVLYARTGDLNGAVTALQRAVDLAPMDASIQRNIGDVYLAQAGQAYEQAGSTGSERYKQLNRLLPSLSRIGAPNRAPAVSAAPAADQTASQPADSDMDDAVARVLRKRAQARADGDFDAWLSTFSDDYTPANGADRAAWLTSARRMFNSDKTTTAEQISDVHTERLSNDRVRATYETKRLGQPRTDQAVALAREDGTWRITSEG